MKSEKKLAEKILESKSLNEDMHSNSSVSMKIGETHVSVGVNYSAHAGYCHGSQGDQDIEMQAKVTALLKADADAFIKAATEKLKAMSGSKA